MRAQTVDHVLFVPLLQFLLDFLQREVHHVMVVHFQGCDAIAEPQPQPVQEIHFVGGQVRRVRPEDFVNLVPAGQVNLKVELRLRVTQFLPGFPNLPGLFFVGFFGRTPDNNGAGLQGSRGAQDAVPQIVGGDHRQANGFAAFLGHGKYLGEELLFDAAEELFGLEFMFAGSGAAQQAHVEDDKIAASGFDAVEDVAKMVERVVIADGNEDIAGTGAHGLGREFALLLEIELIELGVGPAALSGNSFGDLEDDKKNYGETDAGERGDLLGKEVDDAESEKRNGDEGQADGDFQVSKLQIQGHTEFAFSGLLVAKHQHGQAFHRETPHHAKGVGFAEHKDVPPAQDDGEELEDHHEIEDAMGSAETAVRLPEPLGKDAVLGYAVQHAVRPHDGGVDGSGEHQDADDDHQRLEGQPQVVRADKIHGQTANQVSEVLWANRVRNDRSE